MNRLANELNSIIETANPFFFSVLSRLGKELFFPRGILTQTAEAREKALLYNATIGIAREGGSAMSLGSIMDQVPSITPDDALDYAPSYGLMDLRVLWKEKMLEKNRSLAGKSTSLPVVTSGITHGLTVAGEMFIDPGDIVLLADKFWGNYNLVFSTRLGAEMRTFPLFTEDGHFNTSSMAEELDKALADKGKVFLLLNFPNNPTGFSPRRSEVEGIADAIVSAVGPGRDIVAVLDDAYFDLFFEDDCFDESLFGLLADRSEHLFPVKLDGITKEEYAWGLRVGFITVNVVSDDSPALYSAFEKKVGGAIRGCISNCSKLSQTIALRALRSPGYETQKAEKYDVMKARARRTLEVLDNQEYASSWEAYPFNAGYFMCVRPLNVDAEELRVRLLERYGVGVIASGGDIRVAFSCLEVEEVAPFFDIMHRCIIEMNGAP